MFSVSQFALPMKRAPSAPVPAAVRALLRRWRAQRPLRAGSLLVTIFGDAIAPRGAAVTLGSLIRLAAPFGLTERLVRTSVARLARDGWLAARRSGRRSEYRLTRGGPERFAEATRRIYGQSPGAWDGRWTLLVMLPGSASRRGRPSESALRARAALPAGTAFVVRTLLIHEYRKIHLQDPLLPPALLPPGWVGSAAYELCRRLYARVFAPAEGYLSATARRLHRPLPSAHSAAYSRFGGLVRTEPRSTRSTLGGAPPPLRLR